MRAKRIAIIGGGICILLIVGLLAAVSLIDVDSYRPQVQSLLRDRLQRDVTIGHIGLSFRPLGVRVQDTVIGEAPAINTGRPFARAREIYVSPSIMPLLRGQFELRAVELRQPEIEIVRGPSGDWNFSSLGGSDSSSSDSSLVLKHLTIAGGQIGFTDLTRRDAGAARAIYKNIDLDLTDFAPDRKFGLLLAATLPGEGAQRLSLRGTAGPLVKDNASMTPFEGTAQLDAVSVAGVQRFLDAAALAGTDAVISGHADVRNQQGQISAKGALTFDRTRVHDVPIDYPIAFDFDVNFAAQPQLLTIRSAKLRLDQTPIGLDGTVNLAPETPVLDVHATASNAHLAEAARLASAFGVAFGAGTTVDGVANRDVRASGSANAAALMGTAGLRNVRISGGDIKQPVTTPAIDLTLTPAEIRSNEFSLSTGGTTVGVRAAVTRYTTPAPVIDAHVKAAGDLGEVLDVARAWGVEAVEGMSGSGPLSLDLAATGPLDTLSYSGHGTLSAATLETPALTKPIAIKTAQLSFTRDSAVLEHLAVTLDKTSAEGRLTVRNFTAPKLDFQLSANQIDVRAMQNLLAPAPATARTTTTASSKTAPTPAEPGILLKTTGTGKLTVGSIVYDTLKLENVQATATLDRGVIRLSPVTSSLFGGTQKGSITVDARRSPMSVAMTNELQKVDANRLVSATTSLKDVIRGALASNLNMRFSGDNADTIAKSLNGTMRLDLAQGSIANIDLPTEIANVARFATGKPKAERATSVAALRGTFNVVNGLARTEDLTAAIDGGTLGATGTVNLADQSLDMKLTAVLSSDYTQRVGGAKVGGIMNTALANQQGELVVPMLVTGTMSAPRVAPDVQRIAEMKLKNLVPNLKNPGSLTSGILGAIRGQGQPGDATGAAGGGTAGKIGDVLGAITGRQQQKPAAQDGAAQQKPDAPAKPAAQAPPADTKKQVEDALRGLFGNKKQKEQKPADGK
jgi:uncharacterized protein involved in outer membrane biogenesis